MGKKSAPLFTHENLEVKQELLKAARTLKASSEGGALLASALIYASLAEYLAENLLENLRELTYKGTYVQYAGILFIDERNDLRKRTLGQTVKELEVYQFPDKGEVLRLLKEIADCRNNVFHNLAKITVEEAEKLAQDVKSIAANSEELINKIDVIYAGLAKVLSPAKPPSGDQPPTAPDASHKNPAG